MTDTRETAVPASSVTGPAAPPAAAECPVHALRRDAVPLDQPLVDRSAALKWAGYPYLTRRRVSLGADAFETRLLGRRTLVVAGREGAQLFYDSSRMRRRDAVPAAVGDVLFGSMAVHGLDDEDHRHRKAMILSVLTPEALRPAYALARASWRDAAARWTAQERVTLFDEAVPAIGRAILRWGGLDDPDEELLRVTRDFCAVVDGFATVGPRYARALLARRRSDVWASQLIEDVRAGRRTPPDGTALAVAARHRDRDGTLLSVLAAAQDFQNMLRPTIAVAWFVAFAGLALHEHPQWRERLLDGGEPVEDAFALEVRRLYPFTPMLGAKARRHFTWRGHRIREGQRVILDVHGTTHDPTVWDCPHDFRPDRFLGVREPDPWAYVPQGGGFADQGHRCPGEGMAQVFLKTAIHELVRLDYDVPPQDLRYPMWRIPTRPRSGFVMANVRRRPGLPD